MSDIEPPQVSGPRTHELKLWPLFFQLIVDGVKTFEVRLEDRPFGVDDILHLREWDPQEVASDRRVGEHGAYTGRSIHRRVTMLTRVESPPGQPNSSSRSFVVLGIEDPARRDRAADVAALVLERNNLQQELAAASGARDEAAQHIATLATKAAELEVKLEASESERSACTIAAVRLKMERDEARDLVRRLEAAGAIRRSVSPDLDEEVGEAVKRWGPR